MTTRFAATPTLDLVVMRHDLRQAAHPEDADVLVEIETELKRREVPPSPPMAPCGAYWGVHGEHTCVRQVKLHANGFDKLGHREPHQCSCGSTPKPSQSIGCRGCDSDRIAAPHIDHGT